MERERVLDFIRSFSVDRSSDSLKAIEAEAVRDRVPVIRRETRELLRILLQMKKPEKILEVGAAIGFSSVFMGENTSPDTTITTIENYPPRIARARANIAMAGMESRITSAGGGCCRLAEEARRQLRFYIYGCRQGAVYSFPAGCAAAAAGRRRACLRQCFAGRRHF